MSFALLDLFNEMYSRLDESLPTSLTDKTSSRITISNAIVLLTSVVRSLNDFSPFIQHAIISVISGTAYYKLPTDFIVETGVMYRGTRLRRTVSQDPYFLTSTNNATPYQYDIIFPGTSSSALAVTGNMYILIDPPPNETSSNVAIPVFPGFNDPYLVIFYRARIPTDFTTTNYSTYTFNLQEEVSTLIVDLLVAKIMALEGKANIYQEAFLEAVEKLKRLNNWNQQVAENNPTQINDLWFGSE